MLLAATGGYGHTPASRRLCGRDAERRLAVLLNLVPDLRERLADLSPSILAALLGTPAEQLAERIVTLKVRLTFEGRWGCTPHWA